MIISITALKGGVGKTTTSIHLAAYLQEKAPTLLIDADRNRSALIWSKEDKLPFHVASQAGSTSIIRKYPHIIVDTRARPEPEEFKDLADGSDLLIVPTTPNHLDLDATFKAVEQLQALNANFKVLLTKVDGRAKSGQEAKKRLREADLPRFKTSIPLLVVFEKSSQRGVITRDYPDPRSKTAWSAYEAVGKEILP
ncbi:ParA family protein [Crocosphaera sp. Alani8]|uniref:ParA family protein n=1 Tax=Crocosphaera sp. Alani8 TaxID=3038952 RepID=UPI00313D48E7